MQMVGGVLESVEQPRVNIMHDICRQATAGRCPEVVTHIAVQRQIDIGPA